MALFDDASRARKARTDGLHEIFCTDCRQYIGESVHNLNAMRCYVCQKAFEGHKLTEEELARYNASKYGRRGAVSFLRVPPPEEVSWSKRFSFSSMGSALSRAIGITKPAVPPLKSTQAAMRKKRGRLFENIDLNDEHTGIGSMEAIDSALDKAKREGS